MRGLKAKEYETLEQLFKMKQGSLLKTMSYFLQSKYKTVKTTADYIYAIGDIPIALVAHMDTVFPKPVSELYYDTRKNVMWSPQGLGADDRAGIYAIIQILCSTNLRPHIIFTTDEERGGIGASVLAQENCPFPRLKYMIELDRQGKNDCVFYSCDNDDFVAYIESFGFIEDFGSFSDISILGPAWQVCSTNLSVGYENEHTYIETLNISALLNTIEKVKKMLQEESIPDFKYIEFSLSTKRWFQDLYSSNGAAGDNDFYVHCKKCKGLFSGYEVFPVKGLDGKTCFYCPDCIVENIEWCDNCGEPFEIDPNNPKKICNDCAGGLLECHSTSKKLKNNLMK